ncbi:unnamed protein product (macronuclear) [Paramecium tetraurelia]|uniref:Uncharacterized protein n=1 Tax=Paramecium tetraurelia TaxID=5888 RepID=A0CJX8_PARTE|nr:uncharacterized protein GSPATT00000807001 [Paramecium tetraurelia]CAK71095.1 unnamed protein product [Paramecium tetraurelia]|eukprot:XP_001438492.1 hypothetical protein (macronuclear) [Paramecium tetraurelia strain d4-2]
MQYEENYRKAREFVNQRQNKINFKPYKLNKPQITTMHQILDVIRSKKRSNSQFKYLKPAAQTKQEDNHLQKKFITSNLEPKDHTQILAAKILRLNKITRNKTQVTPISYTCMDQIIEPLRQQTEISYEQNSPLRIRKNIPCVEYQLPIELQLQDNQKYVNNITERKFYIQKSRPKENYNSQQTKNKSMQSCLSHHQIIYKEQVSLKLKRLNQTIYLSEQVKIINSIKNEKIEEQIQQIRKVSGWTIKSQQSFQNLL